MPRTKKKTAKYKPSAGFAFPKKVRYLLQELAYASAGSHQEGAGHVFLQDIEQAISEHTPHRSGEDLFGPGEHWPDLSPAICWAFGWMWLDDAYSNGGTDVRRGVVAAAKAILAREKKAAGRQKRAGKPAT